MAHSHEHHHEHVHELTSLNKSFIIGITLNILFVLVEFGIGFYYDSLGLLSDAGHNLGDGGKPCACHACFPVGKGASQQSLYIRL